MYVTVTVPADKPVTTPPVFMDAVPVPGVIDQVPPDIAFVNAAVEAPVQTVAAPPLIAVGAVFDEVKVPKFVTAAVIPEIVPLPPPIAGLVMFPDEGVVIPLN